jgi:hypothetical protein
MQAVIEQRRMRDKEAYDAFEFERRKTDEITDATERIAAPMRNTFEYAYNDGDLWFQGQNIRDILTTTIKLNEAVVDRQPQFLTELIRNHIELDEYEAELHLAAGSGDDPDVLAVISPIPDAVLAGADLGAYDKTRKKMLVRIYQRIPSGIQATSLSLDRSDRVGMEVIARRFGVTISDEATSEDILATRMWGWSEDFDNVATDVRKIYDDELTRQFGGTWYAGRQDKEILDARNFIEDQKDLLDEHMIIITTLLERGDPSLRKQQLKTARYNFAAALSRRMRGEADALSLAEAGSDARSKGEEYTSDCPAGEDMTAEESLSSLGLAKKGEIEMTCPHCGFKTFGDPCAKVLMCNVCSATVKNGKLVNKGIGRTGVLAQKTAKHMQAYGASNATQSKSINKQDMIKARYGEHVQVKAEVGVMTAHTVIYDRRSGNVIDKL